MGKRKTQKVAPAWQVVQYLIELPCQSCGRLSRFHASWPGVPGEICLNCVDLTERHLAQQAARKKKEADARELDAWLELL